MDSLSWILLSGVVMVLSGQTGAFAYSFNPQKFQSLMKPLVLFASGTLLGAAFIHLLPESFHHSNNHIFTFLLFIFGFISFHLISLLIKKINKKENFSFIILFGDFIHNAVGGIAISSSFLIDIRLGITTTLAALAHEIPHKVGNFFLLLYNDVSALKASLMILISTSPFLIFGVWVWYDLYPFPTQYLLPFAAGNFIYTAFIALKTTFQKNELNIRNVSYPIFGILLLFLLSIAFSHH